VVVHLAPEAFARDAAFRSILAAKSDTALKLRHPNIVRTLELVAVERSCYWVTEFLPGHTLATILDKRGSRGRLLSLDHYLLVLHEVLLGLEYAHGSRTDAGDPSPIMHRNLCPASVLVGYAGAVKIADYAFAGAAEVTFGRLTGETERLAYLAPERYLGNPVDQRCDIYAVGAMLWDAVAGHPRPAGSSLEQSVQMRLQNGDPDISRVRPDAPAELAAMTRRALAWEPRDRYQTARDLRLDLEAYLVGRGVRPNPRPMLGFMCNHFHADYTALEVRLEAHGPGLLQTLDAIDSVSMQTRPAITDDTPRVSSNPFEETLSSPPGVAHSNVKPVQTLKRRYSLLAAGSLAAMGALAALVWFLPRAQHERALPPADERPTEISAPLKPGPLDAARARPTRASPELGEPAQPPNAPEPEAAPNEARASTPDVVPTAPRRARSVATIARLTRRPPAAERKPEPPATEPPAPPSSAPAPVIDPADRETMSSLGESSDIGAGIDLRSLKGRPQRPIDKEDPYSK
jgi:serine/threonine-protein kinase